MFLLFHPIKNPVPDFFKPGKDFQTVTYQNTSCKHNKNNGLNAAKSAKPTIDWDNNTGNKFRHIG